MVIYMLVWTIFAFVAGTIMHEKHRGARAIIVAGILGPIGLVAAIMVADKPHQGEV